MDFQHLSDVHSGRYAQRIQNDIQRTAVRQERHIFNRKYTGNNTLVTVTTSHFVTNRNLTFLSNINTNRLIYTRRKLVTVLSCKYFSINNDTVLTMRNLKGSISYLSRLLTEDRTEQTFFCSKLCLSLRSNFTYQNVSCTNLSTDTDDTALIKVFQSIVTNARNISCDLFRSQLGISGFCFIFFNMDRCINIVLNKFFT